MTSEVKIKNEMSINKYIYMGYKNQQYTGIKTNSSTGMEHI